MVHSGYIMISGSVGQWFPQSQRNGTLGPRLGIVCDARETEVRPVAEIRKKSAPTTMNYCDLEGICVMYW